MIIEHVHLCIIHKYRVLPTPRLSLYVCIHHHHPPKKALLEARYRPCLANQTRNSSPKGCGFPKVWWLAKLYIISKRKTGRISRLQTRRFYEMCRFTVLGTNMFLRKVLLSRWFSLSKCGICDRSLEGTQYFSLAVFHAHFAAIFFLNLGMGLWAFGLVYLQVMLPKPVIL